MNDLMTNSFLSYVELKKHDQLESNDPNTSQFFDQVASIQVEMEEITNLLFDLQNLTSAAKSTTTIKLYRGLRDRMESDILAVLQKANAVKSKLQSLDQSAERSRKSVVNGLKARLSEIMSKFQSLREKIEADVENSSNELGEKEAVVELRRSLREVQKVLVEMAVMVEIEGEKMENIEENVEQGRKWVSGGTNSLYYANQTKKKKSRAWVYSVWGVMVVVFWVCLLSAFVT